MNILRREFIFIVNLIFIFTSFHLFVLITVFVSTFSAERVVASGPGLGIGLQMSEIIIKLVDERMIDALPITGTRVEYVLVY